VDSLTNSHQQQLIVKEGVETLTRAQLDEALEERKILTRTGLPLDFLQMPPQEKADLLREWIELSSHPKGIPKTYLILHTAGIVRSHRDEPDKKAAEK
jgi:hypothetical protein